MKVLFLMVGIPASGKTTARKKLFKDGYTFICPDEYIGYTKDDPWTPKAAKAAWSKADALLKESLLKDDSFVVFDATFVSVKKRKKYIDIAKKLGADVGAVFVNTSGKVCRQRNASRDNSRQVPNVAMNSFLSRLEAPNLLEGFKAIINYDGESGKIINFISDNDRKLFKIAEE